MNVGVEGIHMHLLPTGKVLMYGYSTDETGNRAVRICVGIRRSRTRAEFYVHRGASPEDRLHH